jgi:methionine-rich copper-binding protein CopC
MALKPESDRLLEEFPMSNLIRTFAVAALVGLGLGGPALAHAHLQSAAPAEGSTVATAPAEIDLTFSEAVELKFTGIEVTGPGKAAVKTGAASLADGNRTIKVPLQSTLAPGTYTVAWHALSTDGTRPRAATASPSSRDRPRARRGPLPLPA